MMPRPTQIRIGATKYQIRWENDEWSRSANTTAQIDYTCAIIRVSSRPEIRGARLAALFLHEVVHGLVEHTGLHDDLTEERACDMASYGVVDVWLDNPDVFNWWAGLIKEDA